MKGVLIAIISVAVLILGIVVAITYFFGRSDRSAKTQERAAVLGRGGSGGDLGVFISRDAGVTWQQEVSFGPRASIGGVEIADIAFDPKDPQRVYLGTVGNGLLTSASSPPAWSRVADEKNVLPPNASVYQVALDAEGGRIYLAGIIGERGKALRSDDGGASFQEIYTTVQPKSGVYSIVVDPGNTQRVYIGTSEGGMLVSDDRGQSWSAMKWFKDPIGKITLHPRSPNLFLVTFLGRASTRLSRSADGGKTWEDIGVSSQRFSSGGSIFAVSIDPSNPAVFYLATTNGVFRSDDAGKIWQSLPLIVPAKSLPVLAVAVDPANPKRLYIAAASYIYKSADGGSRWEVHRIPTAKNIRVLEIAPDKPDVLWVGIRK